GVSYNLLLSRHRHAVPGREPEQRTLVGGEAGTGMALDNPGDCLGKPLFAEEVRTCLGVQDGMGPAPSDIMEHRTFFHKTGIHLRVVPGIVACALPYSPAVGYNFRAAPCLVQKIFERSPVRHGRATFLSLLS